MDRAQKREFVEDMHEVLAGSELVVVTHYRGLSVAQMEDLRARMREAGGRFKVTKNRLLVRALKDTPFEKLEDMFTGPTAVACSKDPVAAAKVAYEFSRDNEDLAILGGGLGAEILDAKQVENLAKLPSLDEVRSKLASLLQTPAQRMATVLQAPATQLARVTKAYSETDG